MHPPLDRPHPDCNDVIQELKTCHLNTWKKYTGGCNDIKVRLDGCLRAEKKRLLEEMNQDLPERAIKREEIVKQAFGKQVTFSEYLQQDKDYQRERQRKQQQQQ